MNKPENIQSFEDWQTEFAKAAIQQRQSMWMIGDLLYEGLEIFEFDEGKVWTVAECTGHQYQTLANYKSVAKKFPKGKRRLNIAFGLHAELVSLDDVIRDTFLDCIELHGWVRTNVRDRVKAWKGGELEAIKPEWKPVRKTIEVEEDDPSFTAGGKDDVPVFDNGDFADGQNAERREKLDALGEQDLNDANQTLLNALSAVERATTASNVAMLNRDRLNEQRIRAAIVALQDLLPRAHRKPVSKPVEITPPTEATSSPPPAPTYLEEPEMPEFLRRQEETISE